MPPRISSLRRNPEKSRIAIMQAAAHEFATEGLAGARTERIARAAAVNKALIHYYFKDKETLYGAVLDSVFSGLLQRLSQVLARPGTPREKLLAWAGAHFDYIAASPIYPRLVQREMMRGPRSPHLRRIVRRYLRPVQQQVSRIVEDGMRSGEFRRLDAQHFLISTVAMNVFYFSSASMIAILTRQNPLTPERIRERRAAVLDLISAALLSHSAGKSRSTRRKGQA
jgi:TetR/AcrR family transcriptional regulator